MFNRVRVKFITLSMTTLFVLLSLIVISMNVVNYKAIMENADSTLDMLADNKGGFPSFAGIKLPPFMSQETPYKTRYFSVIVNGDNEIVDADISKIAAVDAQEAYEYAVEIMEGQKERGGVGKYRYINQAENGFKRIIFLDIGHEMYSFWLFLKISIMMGAAGYVIFFIIIFIFSGRIMRPVAESYEKQRRFITDAGHEIKTPLAIMNADVEVIEMELGENEWLTDIQRQIKRLTGLTNDLVYLSRLEEEQRIQRIEFPFSDIVRETAESFGAVAKTQNKVLDYRIMPGISFVGDEKAIRQLVNILMDNALKYSPENSTISVEVKSQGKKLIMVISNITLTEIPKEDLEKLFERFYRLDSSRSTKTGGYGIGLSVAKAIVSAHSGKIHAMTAEKYSLSIVVSL